MATGTSSAKAKTNTSTNTNGPTNTGASTRATTGTKPIFNGFRLKDNSVRLIDNNYEATDVLKPIADDIGKENILGCVKTQGQWIITLKNREDMQLLQRTGIKIKGQCCPITGVTQTLLTVSFFGVPSYIDDYDLTQKLEEYGCKIKSKWTHKCYEQFSNIENGIRFVRLELPSQAKSLPYAVTINNVHMKLKHNGQLRVCNLCLSEDHLMKECPHYQCRECGQQGHTARRCPNIRCYKCDKAGHRSFQCKEIVRNEEPYLTHGPTADPTMTDAESPMKTDNNMKTPSNIPTETELSNEAAVQKPRPTPKHPQDQVVGGGKTSTSQQIDEKAKAKKQSESKSNDQSGTSKPPQPKKFTYDAELPVFQMESNSENPFDFTTLKRSASSDDFIIVKPRRTSSTRNSPNVTSARKFTPRGRPKDV